MGCLQIIQTSNLLITVKVTYPHVEDGIFNLHLATVSEPCVRMQSYTI